jgi:hypothetical protein
MQHLLTDDEIVALATKSDRPWQFPLLTVRTDVPAAVAAAALRGLRSLIVRGLAAVDSEGIAVDASLVNDYKLVASAPRILLAHASPADSVAASGSAVIVFYGDAGVYADTMTVVGIHALRQVTHEEALSAIKSFAMTAFEGSTPRVGDTTVIIGGAGLDTVLRVRRGAVDEGTVQTAERHNEFLPVSGAGVERIDSYLSELP